MSESSENKIVYMSAILIHLVSYKWIYQSFNFSVAQNVTKWIHPSNDQMNMFLTLQKTARLTGSIYVIEFCSKYNFRIYFFVTLKAFPYTHILKRRFTIFPSQLYFPSDPPLGLNGGCRPTIAISS